MSIGAFPPVEGKLPKLGDLIVYYNDKMIFVRNIIWHGFLHKSDWLFRTSIKTLMYNENITSTLSNSF